MIKISNVTKIYKTHKSIVRALDNINMKLPDRGFVALCGENGCGKTTLLNLISTLDCDFTGEITIDNLNVKKDSKVIRKNIISYVFQQDYFIDNLNVSENLAIETDDDTTISEQLSLFQLSDKSKNYHSELSGGQRQRTSFIRGLLKSFDILLVDEPTSSMDEEMESYVFNTLRNISKSKLVILVSHNMPMVNAFCDIVIKLNRGIIENVKENTIATDIIYKKNEIIFSNELNLKCVDNQKANSMMDEYGTIILKRENHHCTNPLYKYNNTHEYSKINASESISKKRSRLMFKSSVSGIGRLIAVSIVLCILLLLLESVLDLNMFDEKHFILKTFRDNDETLVRATYELDFHSSDASYDNNQYNWTKDDILFLREKYGVRIDEVTDWSAFSGNDIQVGEIWNNESFYETFFTGYCKSNISSNSLLAGSIPTSYSEYLITDYYADGLIQKSEFYSSYEDIITNGIDLGGYLLSVCGILDTNYEKYRDMKDDDWTDKISTDYQDAVSYFYNNIYCADNIENAKEIGMQYVSIGNFHADVVLSDDIPSNSSHCYINSAFAEKLDLYGNSDIKLQFGYLTIDDVVDDGKRNPTVYVGESVFSRAVDNENGFQNINIDISNRDVLTYLLYKDIEIHSYTGSYIYKVTKIVTVLESLFAYIVILFGIALAIYVFCFIWNLGQRNRKLYVFQKMYGMKKKYYISAELGTVLFVLTSAAILNIFVYSASYFAINSIISNLFSTSVNLLMNSAKTYVIATIGLLLTALISYFVKYIIIEKKNLIVLLD